LSYVLFLFDSRIRNTHFIGAFTVQMNKLLNVRCFDVGTIGH